MPAIATQALSRRFGEFTAVDSLDVSVEEGEIYGFLGPNGAGKSTTVRMLVTLLKPTSGDATVAGSSVTDHPGDVRLRIGAALQSTALDPNQTGRELLALQARLYGLGRGRARRRIDELVELVDIGDAVDARISTYSGGMRRRIDLAAALVHSPEILFLDEPTTGLDPLSRARVWEEVRRLNAEAGVTVFLTTQYLEEADRLADRVAIIDRGRIAAEGTPVELKRTVGTDVILVRTPAADDALVRRLQEIPGVDRVDRHGHDLTIAAQDGSRAVGPVAVALHQAGVDVEELVLRTASLDDVFLEVTGTRFASDDEEQES
ncbi:daunorubicin resistance protein DrrA family ABC transporter ATP-binding protein [Agromyces luteolus]|uniref:ATP-binding cassette domain-containing protein n=1 Tax=Agromyces luteolus TaxID=88373 RepID=A0A7C9HI20_9MICO|nr:ATP-binding cassette domain-containing protein [Agromyces luteolus]MUN05762.1 ATP-binding cassette domain-containing protein [Agromyces luteolus]GLK26308.1 daunorubicin resistance protein DrrA family ABC transporter ATP-binding protein [Agromyces luteolus]